MTLAHTAFFFVRADTHTSFRTQQQWVPRSSDGVIVAAHIASYDKQTRARAHAHTHMRGMDRCPYRTMS